MAHFFDVFDATGTHACFCQSSGGLARTIIKCIVKLTSMLLNPVCFFSSVGFNGKINQNYKNTGVSSTDVNFTIHFIIVLARPPLLWQEHAWVLVASKKE